MSATDAQIAQAVASRVGKMWGVRRKDGRPSDLRALALAAVFGRMRDGEFVMPHPVTGSAVQIPLKD